MSQLVTGEAVALDLRTASAPSRILAGLLDVMIQFVLYFVLILPVGAVAGGGSEAQAAALIIITQVLVGIGYPVASESLMRGRTLGKMALGLRVVRDDGGAIRFRHALVRGLLGFFIEKPGITLGAAGIISILLNERGKRLGDFAAGTMVVQERVAVGSPGFVPMPPPLAAWATSLDLTRLPDDVAMSARSFLLRFQDLTPAAQQDLGSRLAASVAAVVSPEPPPGTPHWAYLSAVLAERRRRAEAAAWGGAAGQGQGYAPPQGYGPQGYPPQGYGPQGYPPQDYGPPQGQPPAPPPPAPVSGSLPAPAQPAPSQEPRPAGTSTRKRPTKPTSEPDSPGPFTPPA